MGRRPSTDEGSTLTPLMFQILLALSQGERHGYAVMQESMVAWARDAELLDPRT